MHLDLRQAESDPVRDVDVCIVGCGAAGITAARRLLSLGHSVLMLESGGLDYEPETAALNAGPNLGEPYYDLEDSRLRFFGGTTAIWGGRVAALDPIDFEPRSWVPHSGWPFRRATLDRYYAEARGLFDLPPEPLPLQTLAGIAGAPAFSRQALELGLWEFDGRFNRFTFDACQDVVQDRRCTVVTHATVTELRMAGGRIDEVTAKSLSGRTLRVRPRAVLLAAGGVENPRLLLANRIGGPLVGRYFMEHPHARGGRVVAGRVWPLLKAFGRSHLFAGRRIAGLIRPSEAAQARLGLLNTSLTIGARQPAEATQFWGMRAYEGLKHQMAPTRGGRALWMATKKAATWAQRHVDPLRPWLLHRMGRLEVSLVVRAEQAPNPDSRVLLSHERDALGVPRAALDWRLSRLDVESVAGLVQLVGQELERLGLGRVEPAEWLSDPAGGWRTDPLISTHPIAGYHHMGATRMAEDPRAGVVDPFGRVHGTGNLYVAGSSVFPTGGWANPTLTIAALALRTADRVADRLASPEAVLQTV